LLIRTAPKGDGWEALIVAVFFEEAKFHLGGVFGCGKTAAGVGAWRLA